jgi:TolB protein
MKKFLFLVSCFLLLASAAEGRIYIPVDQPSDKRFPIAITHPVIFEGYRGLYSGSEKIHSVIENDLLLSGYFDIITESAFLDQGTNITADTINFSQWTAIEASALVKGLIKKEGGKYVIQLKLFDPYSAQMLVGKQYTADEKDIRSVAHRFSDEIMEALTGTRGIFNTKIAYSSAERKGKSIYVMDVDGENNQKITKDSSINLGPAWSPDGSQLAYASFKSGNPEIFVSDLKTGNSKQITKNKSTNITPAWYVDNKTLYFSSSLGDSTEIFAANHSSGKAQRITNVGGINIAPRFSKDGNLMVYSSTRAGRLHVYTQLVGGGEARRLTFVGVHNDSPDISPDGSKIVFCGQDSGTFDIFIMNIDGANIQRLTIDSGSNEHPRWSPDGRFIVFSSTRSGSPVVYMMRADGSNQVKISKGNGALPDWGPRIN